MAETTLLELDGVNVRFGGLAALSDVSFKMDDGRIKGLIGPNGAGKSTLFNVIAGVMPPSSGTVHFKGVAIGGRPAHERATIGIARTFQNLQLFRELSVLENVMVGCHARSSAGIVASVLRTPAQRREEQRIRETAMQTLQRLGLERKASAKAGELSFGESKILELARALASEPTLLLLDEPVAGVPYAEVEQVVDLIRAVNASGVGILLVEHNMSFVMGLCDDIVVLNYGRKIAEGHAADIRRDPEVLRAYLGDAYHA